MAGMIILKSVSYVVMMSNGSKESSSISDRGLQDCDTVESCCQLPCFGGP